MADIPIVFSVEQWRHAVENSHGQPMCGSFLSNVNITRYWGPQSEVSCVLCIRKLDEKEVDMAAKSKSKTASQSKKPGILSLPPKTACTTLDNATEQGTREGRECLHKVPHLAHGWFSYITKGDVWCKGTGVPHPYAGSPTTTPKTDYSEGQVDSEGKPWRTDYSADLGVSEARRIAFHMHRNQKDKIGVAYGHHLEAVRQGVVVLGGTVEEQIAALFHDAVEDHHTTYEMLTKIGVTEYSIKLIEAVSKRPSEEQSKYRDRIKEAGDGAMRVKLADLLHNTRHDRMDALKKTPGGEYTVTRLLKKYRPTIAFFMLELSLIVDEDEQKKLATKPAGSATGAWSGSSSTGKTETYKVDEFFPGDWITATSAPILRKVHVDEEAKKGKGEVVYLLCNGQTHTEDLRWSNSKTAVKRTRAVYLKQTWYTDTTITFSGVTEDDIADYIDILDNLKPVPSTTEEKVTPLTPPDVVKDLADADNDYSVWDSGSGL